MNPKMKFAAVIAALFLGAVGARTAIGAETEKAQERSKNIEAGYEETKDLLRLMDKDKNGKVSKKEFMSFMEEEFDRLDVNKDGELDVSELSRLRVGKRTGGAGSK